MAEPENGQVVFGKKSQKAEAAASAGEETPEEAYKKAHQSLNKAAKAFSSAVDKLQLLKTSLANKQKEQPSAQLAASVGEMESLQKQHEDLKSQWVTKLAAPWLIPPKALPGYSYERLFCWPLDLGEMLIKLTLALVTSQASFLPFLSQIHLASFLKLLHCVTHAVPIGLC